MWELNSSGDSIIKNEASNLIIKTNDASRVIVSNENTEIVNKLKTSGGIVGPTSLITYDISMVGYMVGYRYTYMSAEISFTSNADISYTELIPIGIWLMTGGHIIYRRGATFTAASYTQMLITISSGTGTLNALDLVAPFSNQATSTPSLISLPITTGCLICQTPCTIKMENLTVMTRNDATRASRLVFRKIA